jgi:hypothetical protein
MLDRTPIPVPREESRESPEPRSRRTPVAVINAPSSYAKRYTGNRLRGDEEPWITEVIRCNVVLPLPPRF